MSARIVAVLNQKGGVGKTTTSVNLTHALAKLGKKITVIDFDPQSHLAVSLGSVDTQTSGIDKVLLEGASLAEQSIPVRKNLNLVVAGPRLQEIEQLTDGGARRGDLLRRALLDGNRDEDFIFIDCPPSSGVLVANALFAADEILVPMTSDYLALQGLSHLVGTIRKFESASKRPYKFSLVMSRYIPARRMSKEVLSVIQKYFPGQILATTIRETALLAECPSFGKTIFEYRPGCRSARDFMALAEDFLEGRMM
ncbi:ParA family protein [Methylomonas sp. ZR1]|uniref:ParA family protein n=1 Tax=Methylomonas sp. ZR1 TaxID=1797072 RepID=UPI001492FA84|nr:ParA family protein [Methylomonas sp. ZR1]NOV28744.1 ParA family protein [Methylomonas sp. ZR1]